MDGMKKRARRLAKELILPKNITLPKLRELSILEQRKQGIMKSDYNVRLWNRVTRESVTKCGKGWLNENGTISIRLTKDLSTLLKVIDPKWMLTLIPNNKED